MKPCEAVAEEVYHVDDGVEVWDRFHDAWEAWDGVENTAEENQRLEDEVLEEGCFVEIVCPDAGENSEEAKEKWD